MTGIKNKLSEIQDNLQELQSMVRDSSQYYYLNAGIIDEVAEVLHNENKLEAVKYLRKSFVPFMSFRLLHAKRIVDQIEEGIEQFSTCGIYRIFYI